MSDEFRVEIFFISFAVLGLIYLLIVISAYISAKECKKHFTTDSDTKMIKDYIFLKTKNLFYVLLACFSVITAGVSEDVATLFCSMLTFSISTMEAVSGERKTDKMEEYMFKTRSNGKDNSDL